MLGRHARFTGIDQYSYHVHAHEYHRRTLSDPSLRLSARSGKRKIRAYEEAFERKFGYRPSHADRAKDREMKRCMSELSRARRDLKQLKTDGVVPSPAVVTGQSLSRGDSTALAGGKENRTPVVAEDGGDGECSLQQTVADVTRVSTGVM